MRAYAMKSVRGITASVIYLFAGVFFILEYPAAARVSSLSDSGLNYIVLLASYFFAVGLFLYLYYGYELDIFEPFFLCSIIMIMIFIIMPVINMITDETLCFGTDVMDGCLKGTLLFDFSYLAFCIGYFTIRPKDDICIGRFVPTSMYEYRKPIEFICIAVWTFGLVCSLIYSATSGIDPEYILSLGLKGEIANNEFVGTPLDFLGLFSNSMLTAWMLLLVFGRSKILKAILGIVTLNLYIIEGSRHIIVDMIAAPILYYYIARARRPAKASLALVLALLVLMIGLLGFARAGLKNGWEIKWKDFSFDTIIDALRINFNIYKSYYGVIRAIPGKLDFTYGQQILYTGIMLVPRLFWPAKPASLQGVIIGTGINSMAVISGYAFPNLGEYYAEFGVIGAIILYFIFGCIASKCKRLYQSPGRNENSIIIYSIFLPACMQLIIRGYTPQNFYFLLFILWPAWLINLYVRVRSRHDKQTGQSNRRPSGNTAFLPSGSRPEEEGHTAKIHYHGLL